MPILHSASAWLAEHTLLVTAIGALSIVLLALTVLATPWLIGRLPSDYFSAPSTPLGARGAWRLALLVARTVVGLLFVALGLIMLITPGPGIVALLLGLSLCEFPGKHALVRRLAARPGVFASLNWLRRRTGTPPFRHPYAG